MERAKQQQQQQQQQCNKLLISLLLVGLLFQFCQVATATAAAAATAAASPSRANNATSIRESLKALDSCMLASVFSFIYPDSYPPTTQEALRESCRRQADGFKCLREKSRQTTAILRRGLSTFVQNRQRHHRRICQDLNGAQARAFLQANKCLMEKKLPTFKSLDTELANSAVELVRRNYDDSATELKYLCCAIINYRKNIMEKSAPECAAARAQVEEMIMSIVSNDISLICEDEEKLTSKVCPKLEPMKLAKDFKPEPGNSPSSALLYLIATLGEPES